MWHVETPSRNAGVKHSRQQKHSSRPNIPDSQDELMARVNKTYVVEDPSDDEIDDGEEFESTGAGAAGGGLMPPPSYADLSTFFGPLEHFAQSCGNDEAGNHLRKARMSFIRAFASKPGRQADMREFA